VHNMTAKWRPLLASSIVLAAWLQARELAIQRIKKAIESLGMPSKSRFEMANA